MNNNIRNAVLEEVAEFISTQRNDVPANVWEFAEAIRSQEKGNTSVNVWVK